MSASSKKKLRKEQNAAALTEKQLSEQKEARKLKNQTIAFVVVIALVLVIGLGVLSVTAYKNSGIIERNTIALTIGDHKISAAELSYFYSDAIDTAYSEWYNTYGENTATYLAMFYGLDLTKPLDEQMYDEKNNLTYADYFIDLAIKNAVSAYTMYDLATANGEAVNEVVKINVEYALKSLELNSANAGFRNTVDYLKSVYGNGATEKSFRNYIEMQFAASEFQNDNYDGLSYTDSEIDAYSKEHFDDFSSFSFSTFYIGASNLLECTADKDDEEHEHTQEELDAAVKAAKEAAEAIVAAKPANAEEFNKAIKALDAYADNESAACAENKNQLYTAITNAKVSEWLVDGKHEIGDMAVIPSTTESTDDDGNTTTTTNGFNVVLFQGRNDNEMKLVNVRHLLKTFKNGTTDENGNTVYSEESMKEAENAINTLKDTWLSGNKSEDSFKALVTTSTDDPGSASNGGLYEDIYPGQMVTAFNDWCFDEARQPGDYGVVKTEYGYHLMYFVGNSDVTFRDYMIENTMRNDDFTKWYQEKIDAAKYTVNDTSKLRTNISFAG